MVLRIKSLGFVRIPACSKYERISEHVQASRHKANINEAQIEHQRAIQ